MGDFMTNDHCQRAVVDISGKGALRIMRRRLVSKETGLIRPVVATVNGRFES